MNKEFAILCMVLIVSINGVFIATGSPLSFIHYLIAIGCCLPLSYRLGQEGKQ